MAGWAALSNGAKALAGGGAAVVVAVIAYLIFGAPVTEVPRETVATQPAENATPETEDDAAVAATPEAEDAQPTATDATETASAPEATLPPAPTFDVVRIDAAGNALIAGRAEPGASIELTLNGEVFAQTLADDTGGFAVLGEVPPATEARVMGIRMSTKGGAVVMSDQTVIVAAGQANPANQLADAAAAPAQPAAQTQTAELAATEPDTEVNADRQAAAAPAQDESGEDVAQVSDAAQDTTTAPATAEVVENAEIQSQDTAPELGTSAAQTTETAAVASLATPAAEVEVATDGTAQSLAEAATDGATTTQQEVANVETQADDQSTAGASAAATQPSAPAIILSDAEGVSVLQAGGDAPQVLSAIALDSISYDVSGDVTLAGRGTDAGGFVRVYLNNAPIKTLQIQEDGRWRAPLPDIDTGVYTLRIDEVSAEGDVVSRVETPFKREEPAVLEGLQNSDAGTGTEVSVVTVQPGNTLWGISRANYGEGLMYVHVFEANKDRIRNPDLIYPGQVFTVPELPQDAQ